MKRALFAFLSSLLCAGCAAEKAAQDAVEVHRPESLVPGLKLEPPPGTYTAYRLVVTVTTEKGHELFFAFDAEPTTATASGYAERFEVRIVRSTSLFVSVRSPEGEFFGPYRYEYNLKSHAGKGACSLTPPPRLVFGQGAPVETLVQYTLPASIARLEVAVNDVWRTIEVEAFQGSFNIAWGPLDEGAYELKCRVVHGEETWEDPAAVHIVVDLTPPVGEWVTENFSFDQNTWRNELQLTATDANSGLDWVALCNADTAACLPLTSEGADKFRFSTALTDGTAVSANLVAKLYDLAGNITQLPVRTLDLTAFNDPVPAPAPLPITLTTSAEIDFNAYAGGDFEELRRIDGSALGVGESPEALVLAPGWNEFLFRRPGSAHWHTFGIYQAGVEVALPPTAGQWLIYSSAATLPAMNATFEEALTPNPTDVRFWFRPWLDTNRAFFFVEDIDGDQSWTGADNLYVAAESPWRGGQTSEGPLRIEQLAQYDPGAPEDLRGVMVSLGGGIPAGDIFFEWRVSLETLPALHIKLAPGLFPMPVSVPADGFCLFYLDTHNRGNLAPDSPRAWAPCTGDEFVIDDRSGPLALEVLPGYPLPWVTGMPYGRNVTSVITVGGLSGEPLMTYPGPLLADHGGLGREPLASDIVVRYPSLPASIRLQDESATAEWDIVSPGEVGADATIDVWVEDEAGLPRAAIVFSGSGALRPYTAATEGSWSEAPVAGEAPHVLYAARDGWLSEKTVTDQTSARLRILSPAVTGQFTGVVLSGGVPVVNAEVIWENAGYWATARTGPDGAYALSASGGSGRFSIARQAFEGTQTYEYMLAITREHQMLNLDLPAPAVQNWPVGFPQGAAPAGIVGPVPVTLEVGAGFYQAAFTLPEAGVFSAQWPGFRRQFSLPGALPAFPALPTWSAYSLPSMAMGLFWLEPYARCGDWEQPSPEVILAHWPCWAWLASDEHQTYALGRLLDETYPATTGLGALEAAIEFGNSAPELAYIELHDRLLAGRKIRVTVHLGNAAGAVPAGVYEVRDETGKALTFEDGNPAFLEIFPDKVAAFNLRYY